jgi:EAL domain-containing protein (putative c-di-GMP-specific phosphodiesterase class I)
MDVVAEGVETTGQLSALTGMQCRYVQGWLFGRPMPLAELRPLLEGFDPAVLDGPPVSEMDTRVHTVGQAG